MFNYVTKKRELCNVITKEKNEEMEKKFFTETICSRKRFFFIAFSISLCLRLLLGKRDVLEMH